MIISAYFNEVVSRPQSQNVSRVSSSFRYVLKYLLYVPITLSLSLAPAVIACLAAEMIVHSGFSDQRSTHLLIKTSIEPYKGRRVWVLWKNLVLKIRRCKYVIIAKLDVHQSHYLALSEPSTVVIQKAITPYDPTSPALNPSRICPRQFWIDHPGDEAREQIDSYLWLHGAQPMHRYRSIDSSKFISSQNTIEIMKSATKLWLLHIDFDGLGSAFLWNTRDTPIHSVYCWN